ncbi:MAG: ATP-binding protein, partial [Bacteroidales bacterium]|nr:ATP-binding protein [Bacteroidales bacterium]
FYMQTGRPATTFFFFILLVIQTGSLIYYLNRINRDLANFLIFLQENDTTLAFSRKRIERNFKGLTYHLDKINQKLQEARIDRERQYQYLQTVVEQVNTGIIACDQKDKVVILNKAARELLEIHDIKHLSVMKNLYPGLVVFFQPGRSHPSPVKIKKGNGFLILAVKTSMLKFNETTISLVSFQNIKPELEAGELDAWRKLIRIQRHEIINSITPVTTLTTAIRRRLNKGRIRRSLSEITDEDIDDIAVSIETIEERGRGLIDFVERYRNLTNLPELKIAEFDIKRITDHIEVLFSKELNERKIKVKTVIEGNKMVITADEKLLEQVLINMVKNSVEAIDHPEGEITIRVFRSMNNTVIIQVVDNGTGIDPENIETVFIPSFSTKEKGMGIGLSLCRQIVQLHGGTIRASSVQGKGTMMEIILPA